jgi:cytochrome P450
VAVDAIDFMDPAARENWFRYYRTLREQAPVWRVPATGEYFLSRYEDVIYVLRHPELFPHTSTSSDFRLLRTDAANRYYEQHGWRRKQTLGVDPPVHREYRVLVDPWFNGAGAERARPVIERLASSLLDGWVDDGEVEIVSQFAMPLPVMVVTTVLGFPLDDIEQLKRWSEAWVMPFSRGLSAEQEMYVAEQGIAFQRYIWESPTQGLWRGVARDVEIDGVVIPKGSTVHIRYGAANRDPAMFAEPDQLAVERANAGRHLAFGAGEHRCPGEGLSKLEQRVAVELFLRRMDNVRFTPGKNDFDHLPGFWLRALRSLHVSFDPVATPDTAV